MSDAASGTQLALHTPSVASSFSSPPGSRERRCCIDTHRNSYSSSHNSSQTAHTTAHTRADESHTCTTIHVYYNTRVLQSVYGAWRTRDAICATHSQPMQHTCTTCSGTTCRGEHEPVIYPTHLRVRDGRGAVLLHLPLLQRLLQKVLTLLRQSVCVREN